MTARLLGAVAVLVCCAGCSGTSEGLPAAAPSGAASSTVPTQLSPPVEQPRDVRAFGDTPCEVFTPEQIAGFGFDRPPRQRTLPASESQECGWIDSGHDIELRVTTFPDSDILEREYANRAGYPVFAPIEILGMPAILRENIRHGSRCVVVVGLAERQGINVGFTDLTEPYEDPCGAARKAAEVAVGNLPPLT